MATAPPCGPDSVAEWRPAVRWRRCRGSTTSSRPGCGSDSAGWTRSGRRYLIAALDPRLEVSTGRRLIGSGVVADRIIVRDGDDVILLGHDARPAKVDNLARLPMVAVVDPAAADQRRCCLGRRRSPNMFVP